MKILESSARRYDKGIQMLTGGKLSKILCQAVNYIDKGDEVLDIGCGTGNLSILAAQEGAKVRAIDINPEMLDIAKTKANWLTLDHPIDFVEMGVMELDGEKNKFDVVMSSLCFSELTEEEIDYTLIQINRILKNEGIFILIDETVPRSLWCRILFYVVRIPLKIITYIMTQTTTHPLKHIEVVIERSKLKIISNDIDGSLQLLIATKEEKE